MCWLDAFCRRHFGPDGICALILAGIFITVGIAAGACVLFRFKYVALGSVTFVAFMISLCGVLSYMFWRFTHVSPLRARHYIRAQNVVRDPQHAEPNVEDCLTIEGPNPAQPSEPKRDDCPGLQEPNPTQQSGVPEPKQETSGYQQPNEDLKSEALGMPQASQKREENEGQHSEASDEKSNCPGEEEAKEDQRTVASEEKGDSYPEVQEANKSPLPGALEEGKD